MEVNMCVCVLLTVTGAGVFDLEDEASRAGGTMHLTLAAVRGVVAGTHTVSGIAFRALALARGASSSARPGVPQTLLFVWTVDVVARLGV